MARVVGTWQRNEHEQALRSTSRIADECVGGAAARVVSREERLMVRHPATGRPTLEDDQCADDSSRSPTTLSSDARREPYLGVKPAERVLHVPDASLALGHLQDAGRRMERELVDPAALTIDAVARLNPDLPTSPPVAIGPRLDDARMVRVHEAIKIPAPAPRDVKDGSGVEPAKDATDRPKGVALGPPTFHVGECRWAHIASRSQVHLSPSTALAKGEDRATDPLIVHAPSVRREALSGDYS